MVDFGLQRFFAGWFRAVRLLHDHARQTEVAETASIYGFAGAETISPADVAAFERTTPVHDPADALRHNDLAQGNTRLFVQRLRLLLRLQGRETSEQELARLFDLTPLRRAAAAAASAAAE